MKGFPCWMSNDTMKGIVVMASAGFISSFLCRMILPRSSKQKDAQSKSSSFGWGCRFATTQIKTLNPQLKPPQSSLCCWISASSPRCLVVHHFSFCNTPQKQPVTNQKSLISIFILVSKPILYIKGCVPLPTASQHEGLPEVHLVACHTLNEGQWSHGLLRSISPVVCFFGGMNLKWWDLLHPYFLGTTKHTKHHHHPTASAHVSTNLLSAWTVRQLLRKPGEGATNPNSRRFNPTTQPRIPQRISSMKYLIGREVFKPSGGRTCAPSTPSTRKRTVNHQLTVEICD